MKVAIVGIGAMGCLLGAHLDGAGDIVLLGHWPEQVKTIQEYGLLVHHPDGRQTLHNPRITNDPTDVGQVDVGLVVVKSRQTIEAAESLTNILKPDGLAITLQNGLNNCATLRGILGEHRVSLGVTSEGATVVGPGEIRHAGHGPTYFGRDPTLGDPQSSLLPRAVDLFKQAGFETYLVDNTDGLSWGKLAVNAAINPLTALLRVPNGFLIEHEDLVSIMALVAQEVARVAEAQGIVLPFQDAAERAVAVAKATATNRSSMLQDILRGVPTEVEAICGAVARIGRQYGVPTPLNIKLCRLVKRIEGGMPPLFEAGDVTSLLKLINLQSNW